MTMIIISVFMIMIKHCFLTAKITLESLQIIKKFKMAAPALTLQIKWICLSS